MTLIEQIKDLINRVENANDEKGKWVTIKGTHVFIPDGKSVEDVIKEKGWEEKSEDKTQEDKEKSETKKESNTTKDTRRHIDRIEKLIKKYNLEPREEESLLEELGDFEVALDEGLEPREEEELREQLFDFEDDIKRHQEMRKDGKANTSHYEKKEHQEVKPDKRETLERIEELQRETGWYGDKKLNRIKEGLQKTSDHDLDSIVELTTQFSDYEKEYKEKVKSFDDKSENSLGEAFTEALAEIILEQ